MRLRGKLTDRHLAWPTAGAYHHALSRSITTPHNNSHIFPSAPHSLLPESLIEEAWLDISASSCLDPVPGRNAGRSWVGGGGPPSSLYRSNLRGGEQMRVGNDHEEPRSKERSANVCSESAQLAWHK